MANQKIIEAKAKVVEEIAQTAKNCIPVWLCGISRTTAYKYIGLLEKE